MFAAPVVKAQTKTTASLTAESALQHSRSVARPLQSSAIEPDRMPTNNVGGPLPSWDFGEIPLFSRDRRGRVHSPDTTLPSTGANQAKFVIGQIGDPLEQEADRVADQVMRMPRPAFIAVSAGSAQISRKCALCEAEEEEEIQRKPIAFDATAGEAPPIVHEVLRSPGQPLDSATRAFFEPRFGRTLSHIRVHTDAAAAASARAIGARAYTRGAHIVFAGDSYQTGTRAGRHLLAHELAHTAQQEHGASNLLQRVECSDYNESTAKECNGWPCTTRDGAKGVCKKTGLHVCMCAPARMWRVMPDWLLAVLGTATLLLIVACFATGVCEFALVVAGLGAVTALAVIGILKAAGIKDSKA